MIHDPALDSAGRYGAFLDKAIAELKARDAAPMEDQTKTVVMPPPVPVAATPAAGNSIAKAPMDKFALIAQKVAAVQKKMHVRADRLISRVEDFDKKVETTFDKQEDAVSAGEAVMDALDASLARVGNEEGNA
jgi:hypothetical protein